jgi:hypothetical protein
VEKRNISPLPVLELLPLGCAARIQSLFQLITRVVSQWEENLSPADDVLYMHSVDIPNRVYYNLNMALHSRISED